MPEGLAKSDWQSIRAAYDAGRHAFQPIEGGWQARIPDQRGTNRFDRRGFVAEPKGGGWQWGLELQRYGFPGAERDIQGVPTVQAAGQRLTSDWDATVQVWWVNDARYLLTIDPLAQQADLKASNTEARDRFGWSLALSGDTVVIGAPGEASNAAGCSSSTPPPLSP